MSKLEHHYLQLYEFIFSPRNPTEQKDLKWFQSSKSITEHINERNLTYASQLIGAFHPLARIAKDIVDTGKPYRSWWYFRRDAFQPFYGIGNLLKSGFYLLASPLIFLLSFFYYAAIADSLEDYKNKVALSSIQSLSWLMEGLSSLVRGIFQIATTPLSWFKIIIRGCITAYYYYNDDPAKRDFLLKKNRPGIQRLVKEAQKITEDSYDANENIKLSYYNLLEAIGNKYAKGIDTMHEMIICNKRNETMNETLYEKSWPLFKAFKDNDDYNKSLEFLQLFSSEILPISKTTLRNRTQQLASIARSYTGKLVWIGDASDYTSFDQMKGSVADDFMLLFSGGPIPEAIKQAAEEKYQNLKNNVSILEQQELYMNCWEFCLLVLIDAELISKELIQKVCQIVRVQKKLKDSDACLVKALYLDPLSQYQKFDGTTLPKLGDLLLYKRSNQARPWHAAICIGNEGEYIDFYGWLKESKLENNALTDEEEIYYIPVEALNSNMKAFIENNQTLLSHSIAHEEIKLDAFKNTFYQYSKLVQ